MASGGRVGPARATAASVTFSARTLGVFGISLFAPVIGRIALRFGPADYFALMVLAFVTVSAVLGSSAVRGLTSLAIGLFVGLIGVDLQTGQPRLTFGVPALLDGIDVVIVNVGLFALGETLHMAHRHRRRTLAFVPIRGSLWGNTQ